MQYLRKAVKVRAVQYNGEEQLAEINKELGTDLRLFDVKNGLRARVGDYLVQFNKQTIVVTKEDFLKYYAEIGETVLSEDEIVSQMAEK